MTVTGMSTSRLSELKKYKIGGDFFSGYVQSTGSANDGVDPTKSQVDTYPNVIQYYIDSTTYVDTVDIDDNVSTTYMFEGQGYNSPDFVDMKIIKDPDKSNLVQAPKISNDVFIVRQQLSVFDNNYRLREISNLSELITYAGGSYFNIVNNS